PVLPTQSGSAQSIRLSPSLSRPSAQFSCPPQLQVPSGMQVPPPVPAPLKKTMKSPPDGRALQVASRLLSPPSQVTWTVLGSKSRQVPVVPVNRTGRSQLPCGGVALLQMSVGVGVAANPQLAFALANNPAQVLGESEVEKIVQFWLAAPHWASEEQVPETNCAEAMSWLVHSLWRIGWAPSPSQ